jgi:LPXTG-motif cell wall-anchored protein
MSGYDPKRPRPSGAGDPDDEPPIEALLGPVGARAGEDRPEPEVDLRADAARRGNGSAASPNGASRPTSDVPVAPAPSTGTANRAVLAAAVGAAAIVGIVLLVLRRRRRRG